MANPIDGAFQKKKREGDSSEICAVARYIPVSGYVSCYLLILLLLFIRPCFRLLTL
jgi:hypothetical protein